MKREVSLVARRVANALNQNAKKRAYRVRTGDEDTSSVVNGFVSTGCSALDYYLGHGAFRGGYPLGRVVELFGAESAGKTTLALHALISAQRGRATYLDWSYDQKKGLTYKVSVEKTEPGVAVLIDFERTLDRERAQRMGLDLKNLMLIDNLETLEDGFEAVEALIDLVNGDKKLRDRPVVIVWDTIAAAPTRDEMDSEMGATRPGGKSVRIYAAMRRLIGKLATSKVSLICVNQLIDNIGRYGAPTTSPGGRCLKFMATYRFSTQMVGRLKVGEKHYGIETRVEAVKAKLCEPYRKVVIPIRFTTGIDDDLCSAMFLSDPDHFKKSEALVRFERGKYVTTLKNGKAVAASAPISGRGVTKLFGKHEGLRGRLRGRIRDWWKKEQESSNASPTRERPVRPE